MPRLAAVLSAALMSVALPALADDVVAIAPIQGDLDAARRAQAEGALREATATFAPVQAASETAGHIEAGRALDINCSGADVECWRRVRELASVDRLIVAVDEGAQLKLLLVTRAASLDRNDQLDFTGDLAVGSARTVIARLLDVRAQLTIISNVSGAMVELDGKLVGQAPMRDPVEGLKAGEHKLRVYAANHTEVSRTVELRPGEDAVIQVDLEALNVQKGLNGVFWTGAGLVAGGAVTLVTGGVISVFGLSGGPTQAQVNAATTPGDIDGLLATRDEKTLLQGVGAGVAAAGAAIVVAGTIMLVLAEDME